MNFFDKTPREVALEYELERCKAELEYLKRDSRNIPRYSTMEEPCVINMSDPAGHSNSLQKWGSQ